eukprot:357645-Chlamydomonas_euryale.AAC.1
MEEWEGAVAWSRLQPALPSAAEQPAYPCGCVILGGTSQRTPPPPGVEKWRGIPWGWGAGDGRSQRTLPDAGPLLFLGYLHCAMHVCRVAHLPSAGLTACSAWRAPSASPTLLRCIGTEPTGSQVMVSEPRCCILCEITRKVVVGLFTHARGIMALVTQVRGVVARGSCHTSEGRRGSCQTSEGRCGSRHTRTDCEQCAKAAAACCTQDPHKAGIEAILPCCAKPTVFRHPQGESTRRPLKLASGMAWSWVERSVLHSGLG